MVITIMSTELNGNGAGRQQAPARKAEWTSHRIGRTLALFAAVLLGGCTSIPADLGRNEVNELVAARGQSVDENTGELLSSLMSAPLSAESAVRIALINNPELQASYASLGFAAADVYEAGRIRNPILSGVFLDTNAAGERDQVTYGLVVSFTDLITLPARKRLSRGAFAAMKQHVGADVLGVAAAAEKAYYEYVGAQQVAALRAQIANAGELSARLAQRFFDAGNLAPRELAMERAAASEARLTALEAANAAFAARTALADILGLSVGAPWTAPAALRLPVMVEDDLDTLLALARDARLDLAAARTNADVLADRLGVVNWTRWLGDLDVGVERERDTDGSRLSGPTVDWEVPIFNQHRDALLRADAELQVAISDVRRATIDVDNSVRLANAALENVRARIEEYRAELIPQRIETVARAQEEVNFMLIGIFELIALKQDEYDAYQGYLEAIRDYWLARADLALAVGTSLPSAANVGSERIDVDQFVQPQSGGSDHSGHNMNGEMVMPETAGDDKTMPMDHSGHKNMEPDSGTPKENGDDMTMPMDHSGHKMPLDDKSPAATQPDNTMDSQTMPDSDSKPNRGEHDHGGAQ